MLLIGLPKPDRAKGRDQTTFDPKLPICKLSIGLYTSSYKKTPELERAIQTVTTSTCEGPSEPDVNCANAGSQSPEDVTT